MGFELEEKFLNKAGISYTVTDQGKRLNLACPICGDGSHGKTRGWFNPVENNEVAYSCFNECGHMSVYNFFAEAHSEALAKEYFKELKKDQFINKKKRKTKNPSSVLQFKHVSFNRKSILVPSEKGDKTFSLTSISLSKPAKAYLKGRGFSLKQWKDWYYVKSLDAILFPLYYDREKTKIYGGQLRSISKKKFKTFVYEGALGGFYGKNILDGLAYGSTLYVFESILDVHSTSIENAISSLGSNLKSELRTQIDKLYTLVFCFDNDEAGREAAKKMSDKGYSVLIHPTSKLQYKDMNDLLMQGFTPEKIEKYILRHITSPFSAQFELRLFDRKKLQKEIANG